MSKATAPTAREMILCAAALLLGGMFLGLVVGLIITTSAVASPVANAVVALAGPGIAIASLLLAVVGYRDNRSNHRREQRAYVRLDIQDCRFLGDKLRLQIEFENYGKTAAVDFQSNLRAEIGLSEFDEAGVQHPRSFNDNNATVLQFQIHAVYPEKVRNMDIITPAFSAPEEFGNVANGVGFLRISFWPKYTDIFGATHTTPTDSPLIFLFSGGRYPNDPAKLANIVVQ